MFNILFKGFLIISLVVFVANCFIAVEIANSSEVGGYIPSVSGGEANIIVYEKELLEPIQISSNSSAYDRLFAEACTSWEAANGGEFSRNHLLKLQVANPFVPSVKDIVTFVVDPGSEQTIITSSLAQNLGLGNGGMCYSKFGPTDREQNLLLLSLLSSLITSNHLSSQ